MKIKETAIMLTGFQNDFCSKNGLLYNAVKKVLINNRAIENTVDLLEKTKGNGILTIFTPIVFTEDYRELGSNPTGILKAVKDAGAFKKGTEGIEMIKELKPYIDQITVVSGKRGLCSFGIPEMNSILKEHGIKNVVLGGLLTNICVESTARTAYDKGYTVTILKDCTACKSFLEQEFSEKYIFPLIGDIKTHDEFLKELE
ncbi:MAG: cysteine hydrolase [Nitrospira sp.]|nr:cysteine hydrolase [Nitrospira sp.]